MERSLLPWKLFDKPTRHPAREIRAVSSKKGPISRAGQDVAALNSTHGPYDVASMMDPPLLLLRLALPHRRPLFPGPPTRKPGERVTGKGRPWGTRTRSQMRARGQEIVTRHL